MALAKHDKVQDVCDVQNCNNIAERSLNIKQILKTDLILKSQYIHQVRLCKEHYKILKKQTKVDRELHQIY